MSAQPPSSPESRSRAASPAAALPALPPRAKRPWRRTALAAAAGVLAALALAPLAAAGSPGDRGEPGEAKVTDPSSHPVDAPSAPVDQQVDHRVIRLGDGKTEVIEIARGAEGLHGNAVFVVGADGEAVRMEVEPDGEGGYHWVQRNADGEVLQVRPLDEIAEPGEPRVRAVFIGDEATPFKVECASGEKEGDCPPGFRFDYRFIDPEGLGAHRGYLGAMLTELSPELRAHFGAPEDAGVLVARVEEDSPAAAAGLGVGDVITAIDGEPVAGSFDLRRRVRTMTEGDRATLEVVRGRRVLALPVTIAERELPEVDLRRFLWHGLGEGAKPGEPFVYHLDPEAVNKAVVELKERFAAPEIRRDVVRLRGAEGDLERRIAELEQRIAELEAALEHESTPAP